MASETRKRDPREQLLSGGDLGGGGMSGGPGGGGLRAAGGGAAARKGPNVFNGPAQRTDGFAGRRMTTDPNRSGSTNGAIGMRPQPGPAPTRRPAPAPAWNAVGGQQNQTQRPQVSIDQPDNGMPMWRPNRRMGMGAAPARGGPMNDTAQAAMATGRTMATDPMAQGAQLPPQWAQQAQPMPAWMQQQPAPQPAPQPAMQGPLYRDDMQGRMGPSMPQNAFDPRLVEYLRMMIQGNQSGMGYDGWGYTPYGNGG